MFLCFACLAVEIASLPCLSLCFISAPLSIKDSARLSLEVEIHSLDQQIAEQKNKIISAANKILQNRLSTQLNELQKKRQEKQAQLESM